MKLYKGASHGLAGILQVIFKKLFSTCLVNYYCLCVKVLLGFKDYLEDNPDAERDVKNSVDYILHTQKPDGNFPIVLHDNMDEKKELLHWCHGAGGIKISQINFKPFLRCLINHSLKKG